VSCGELGDKEVLWLTSTESMSDSGAFKNTSPILYERYVAALKNRGLNNRGAGNEACHQCTAEPQRRLT
jgi:hypothetical protein